MVACLFDSRLSCLVLACTHLLFEFWPCQKLCIYTYSALQHFEYKVQTTGSIFLLSPLVYDIVYGTSQETYFLTAVWSLNVIDDPTPPRIGSIRILSILTQMDFLGENET